MELKSTAVLGHDAYPRVSPFRLPRVKPLARLNLKPVRFGETMRADSGPAIDKKDGGADLPKSLQKHFNFFPRPLSVADLSGGPNDGKQLRISFKGLRGSYSEEAALKAYPKCETVPCEEFEDAFKAVELWIVDKAVLPIESSSGGSIHRNYDLLLRHRLHIVGEVQLPVNFCLLALPGVKAEQLKRVMSHPQALDCSEIFLSKLGVARENVEDTAAAAQFIASNGPRDVGAVASARTSEIYGLSILAEKIQDDPDDITRFLILARDPLMPRKNKLYKAMLVTCKLQLDELCLRGLVGENPTSEVASVEHPITHNLKTSVVFTLDEGPGMLFKALAVFALREISLTKIESRPQRNRPLRVVDDSNTGTAKYFDYLFYIDFEASMAEPRAQNALAHLQEFAAFLRVLGCYPMDTPTL